MDEYQVEIRFPRSTDPDPNLVVVAGKDEDSVYDCIDHLRAEEENYLTERQERIQYMAPRVEPQPIYNPIELEIKGAPWQLDMSEDQFPSMGSTQQKTSNLSGAWGGIRRF